MPLRGHMLAAAMALAAVLLSVTLKRRYLPTTNMSIAPQRVIVVGSGLAGLAAAHAALQAGATVHLVERAAKPGGNSIKASSGINGAGTRWQKAAGVSDSTFYPDSVKSAGKRFKDNAAVDRAALLNKLTAESARAVTWLADDIGVDLSVVAQLGGHSVPRTHRGGGKTPPGAAIVTGLLEKLRSSERFTLALGAEVTALLETDGGVTGVRYSDSEGAHELAGAVVFAAGGFAGDSTMLAKHRPDLAGMASTNDARPGAHALLAPMGAVAIDMDAVQVHPTGFVDPAAPGAKVKFLAGEMLRGEGGILLASGKRFVNELDTRDHVSDAIMANAPHADEGDVRQWDVTLLLDPGAAAAAAGHLGFYEWKGLMRRVKVRDLPEDVIAAVDKYAAAVADGASDPFGRPSYGRWKLPAGDANRDEEVFVGRLTPVLHFTMGGLAIDTSARVLRADRKHIPGVWAAGEITGGVHGDNRLGGSSLLECVVFGRTAGAAAAAAAGATARS